MQLDKSRLIFFLPFKLHFCGSGSGPLPFRKLSLVRIRILQLRSLDSMIRVVIFPIFTDTDPNKLCLIKLKHSFSTACIFPDITDTAIKMKGYHHSLPFPLPVSSSGPSSSPGGSPVSATASMASEVRCPLDFSLWFATTLSLSLSRVPLRRYPDDLVRQLAVAGAHKVDLVQHYLLNVSYTVIGLQDFQRVQDID